MNGTMIGALFSLAFAAQAVHIAVPLVLAALGGAITERSGVVDLALEAKLLFGAFAAAAVGHATGSPAAAIAAAMAVGALVAMVQAGCALGLGADQVVVGIALNMIALAGTRFLLQLLYHQGASSPPAPAYGDAVVGNPLVWLAVGAAVAVPFALRRTRWGLRLRAAGDRPEALVAAGVSVERARIAALLVGGALAGAGGAELALAVGGFVADMSSGRGYIAIAMVILAGWRPGIAALACVGIAIAEAVSIQLQVTGVAVPRELAPLLPYALTIVVLAIAGSRRAAPRALNQ